MFWVNVLGCLLLTALCGSEVLQSRDERVSLSSVVCLTAEKQRRQEEAINELRKWLTENRNLFAMLEPLKNAADLKQLSTHSETAARLSRFDMFVSKLVSERKPNALETECSFSGVEEMNAKSDVSISLEMRRFLDEHHRDIEDLQNEVLQWKIQQMSTSVGLKNGEPLFKELSHLKQELKLTKLECENKFRQVGSLHETVTLVNKVVQTLMDKAKDRAVNGTELDAKFEILGRKLFTLEHALVNLANNSEKNHSKHSSYWDDFVAIRNDIAKNLEQLRDQVKKLESHQDKDRVDLLRVELEDSLQKMNNKLEQQLAAGMKKMAPLCQKCPSDGSVNIALRQQENITKQLETIKEGLKESMKSGVLITRQARQLLNGMCPSELADNPRDKCERLEPSKNCYCFVTSFQATWSEADKYCRWHGMLLVSIESKEENSALFSKFKKNEGYWTSGVRDGKYSDVWVWASTERPMNFTQWMSLKEPNGKGHENCLELWQPYQGWNDKSCDTKHYFICESATVK